MRLLLSVVCAICLLGGVAAWGQHIVCPLPPASGLNPNHMQVPPGLDIRTMHTSRMANSGGGGGFYLSRQESMIKGRWVCPVCGYSWSPKSTAVGTDSDDDTVGATAPPICPDPWGLHGAGVAMERVALRDRFLMNKWVFSAPGTPSALSAEHIFAMPFHPGDGDRNTRPPDDEMVAADPTVLNNYRGEAYGCRVGVNVRGLGTGANARQVRLAMLPPGCSRPTARVLPSNSTWSFGTGGTLPVYVKFAGTVPTNFFNNTGATWQSTDNTRCAWIVANPYLAYDEQAYIVEARLEQHGNTEARLYVTLISGDDGQGGRVLYNYSDQGGAAETPAVQGSFGNYSGLIQSTPNWAQAPGITLDKNGPGDTPANQITDTDRLELWSRDGALHIILPSFQNYILSEDHVLRWRFATRSNLRMIPRFNLGNAEPPAPPPAPGNFWDSGITATPGEVRVNDGQPGPDSDLPITGQPVIPFELRPGEVGRGQIMVQWRDPTPAGGPNAGNPWLYDMDLDGDNGIQTYHVDFFSSSVEVMLTGDTTWDPDGPGPLQPPAPPDPAANPSEDPMLVHRPEAWPRVVIGDSVPGGWGSAVSGLYNPGALTPSKAFWIRNPFNKDPTKTDNDADGTPGEEYERRPGGLVLRCPKWRGAGGTATKTGCGAVFQLGSLRADGGWHDGGANDYCDFCGTKLDLQTANPTWDGNDALRGTARVAFDRVRDLVSRTADAVTGALPPPIPEQRVKFTPDYLVLGAGVDDWDGPPAPYTANSDFTDATTTRVAIDIPRFQPPSVDEATLTDHPYLGVQVAYRARAENNTWLEDPANGLHRRVGPEEGPGVFDDNGQWDVYYQCPDDGNKQSGRYFTTASGKYANDGILSDNQWGLDTTGPLPDSRRHRACTCDYDSQGPPNSPYDNIKGPWPGMTGGEEWPMEDNAGKGWGASEAGKCPFHTKYYNTLTGGNDDSYTAQLVVQTDKPTEDDLTAEEYAPFMLQVSVAGSNLRARRLEAQTETVDYGRVSPGPGKTSAVADFRVANETGVGTAVLRGAASASRSQADVVKPLREPLYRTEVDGIGTSATRSNASLPASGRWEPVTTPTLKVPRAVVDAATGFVRTDWRKVGAATRPVPVGTPAGYYQGTSLFYTDVNGDGTLNFFDMNGDERFQPHVDLPFEPVILADASLRVTESWLPHNDRRAGDAHPVANVLSDVSTPGSTFLQVLWSSDRTPGPDGFPAQGGPPPPANHPWNLLGVNGLLGYDPLPPANPNYDPLYRELVWGGVAPASLPGTDYLVPGAVDATLPQAGGPPETAPNFPVAGEMRVNSMPEVYIDPTAGAAGDAWLIWQRRMRGPGRAYTALVYSHTAGSPLVDPAADTTNWLYGDKLTQGAGRGFVSAAEPPPANHWLFWAHGDEKAQRIYFRANFDPTSPASVEYDGPLPLTSSGVSIRPEASASGTRRDTVDGLDVRWIGGGFNAPPGPDVGTDGAPVLVRRTSQQPFSSVKDPWPVEHAFGTDPYVDLYFSGTPRREQGADICVARFYEPYLGTMTTNVSFGRQPFTRQQNKVTFDFDGSGAIDQTWERFGEELEPDGARATFQSRHLDWLVRAEFPGFVRARSFSMAAGAGDNTAPLDDPALALVAVRDVLGDGLPPSFQGYWIVWDSANHTVNRYDPKTGLYYLRPLLVPIAGGGAPAVMIDPATSRPLRMILDVATGTVRFSKPLFNANDPGDANDEAVFYDTTAPTARGGPGGVPNLADVQIVADYTPFIYRLTRSGATDDTPSAFFDAFGRLTVFWRRSHAATEAPYFGSTELMYRTFSRSIQVARPPMIGAASSIVALDGSDLLAQGLVAGTDTDNGVITFAPLYAGADGIVGTLDDVLSDGRIVTVTYTSGAAGAPATVVERHQILGWSKEQVVPATDTVMNEGPVTVRPEAYTVTAGTNAGQDPEIPANSQYTVVRYWVFWSSTRPQYDPAFDTTQPPGFRGYVLRSSDVYYTTVCPTFGSLISDIPVPRIPRNGT